jgi:hypothetical protein
VDCKALDPAPASFNECPGALNNAGLAFDMTYTRYYPLFHDLYAALGRDLGRTVEAIQQPLERRIRSEADAERHFRARIESYRGRAEKRNGERSGS